MNDYKSLSKRKKFNHQQLQLIDRVNSILYSMPTNQINVRSLYYQLVSAGVISFDSKEYDKLSALLSDARYHNLIDNDLIADYTRTKLNYRSYDSKEDALEQLKQNFKLNPWATQPTTIEVWYEKEGIKELIQLASSKWRLPMLAVKGQPSTTIMLDQQYSDRKHILYLGDLDISGVDISDRLESDLPTINPNISVDRLGITHKQGDDLAIPKLYHKNPHTTAADKYNSRFGKNYGYEIDALPLSQMTTLIDEAVSSIINHDMWEDTIAQEQQIISSF